MSRRNALQHAIRGCGNVPGYGDHPGTVTLVILVLMGFAAGASRSWERAFIGAAVMLAAFGPVYLYGAYDRSRSADRRSTNHQRRFGRQGERDERASDLSNNGFRA